MTPFDHPEFRDHEQVVFCADPEAGLRAIIAIHDTTLGPGLGGVRMYDYASHEDALTDVLRLSRGMTYKNSLAGLDLGGAKAVIIGDPRTMKTTALMRAFGRHVHHLGGRYVTAEDVGMTTADLDAVALETPHAGGTSGRGFGDPSPYTAHGVVAGIRAALAHRHGDPSPAGRTIAVMGVGHVGEGVAERLQAEGARLVLADVREDAVSALAGRLGARVVPVEEIHRVEADLFSPNALGGILSARTIPELGAPIVAGGANNQLATPDDAQRLTQRGILYAPDYVINAGGVISIALGFETDEEARVFARCDEIAATLAEIFARAEREGVPTAAVADRMAEERIGRARGTGEDRTRGAAQ